MSVIEGTSDRTACAVLLSAGKCVFRTLVTTGVVMARMMDRRTIEGYETPACPHWARSAGSLVPEWANHELRQYCFF